MKVYSFIFPSSSEVTFASDQSHQRNIKRFRSQSNFLVGPWLLNDSVHTKQQGDGGENHL